MDIANIKNIKITDFIGQNVLQIATLVLGFIPFLLNNKGTVISFFTGKAISTLFGDKPNSTYETPSISAMRAGVDSFLDKDKIENTFKKVIAAFILTYVGHEIIFTQRNIDMVKNNTLYQKYVPNIFN